MKIFKQRGFTIIELMIAVILMAVLLTMGVPSFSRTIEQNKLSTQVNDLISTMQYARSESVKTGKRITICKSNNGTNCVSAAAGYESGWIVFEDDSPADGDLDAGEQLLKVHEALESNFTLRGSNSFVNFISYLPSGGVTNTNPGHFVLCKENVTSKSRAFFINTAGRTRVAKDTNYDNIPEDDAGSNITTCTP
ncbi:MAG: GspH/FimT family pseudopilin [Gammaproteobacteria bacterium]|nr:GspH/FimT family pseudopilin [Gammaproteobacteria bacterium]